jgi:hypothetical protein
LEALQNHFSRDGKRLADVPDVALNICAGYGPDYRADLDLGFANPDGVPLKPDSVSATISALFRWLQIQQSLGSTAPSS